MKKPRTPEDEDKLDRRLHRVFYICIAIAIGGQLLAAFAQIMKLLSR